MKDSASLQHIIPTIIAIVFLQTMAFAQGPSTQREMVLQVRGLTSEMRDGLANELQREGHYRIAFACVPAGIILLESTDATRRVDQQADLMPVVHRRIDPSAIRSTNMLRRDAEAACAEARNQ
ncbi:MAG: hypothetical protein R2818_06545 [Flavobacteriales bacterium]